MLFKFYKRLFYKVKNFLSGKIIEFFDFECVFL